MYGLAFGATLSVYWPLPSVCANAEGPPKPGPPVDDGTNASTNANGIATAPLVFTKPVMLEEDGNVMFTKLLPDVIAIVLVLEEQLEVEPQGSSALTVNVPADRPRMKYWPCWLVMPNPWLPASTFPNIGSGPIPPCVDLKYITGANATAVPSQVTFPWTPLPVVRVMFTSAVAPLRNTS